MLGSDKQRFGLDCYVTHLILGGRLIRAYSALLLNGSVYLFHFGLSVLLICCASISVLYHACCVFVLCVVSVHVCALGECL